MAVAETLMQPAIATAMEILEEGLGILWFPLRTNAVIDGIETATNVLGSIPHEAAITHCASVAEPRFNA
jgi:hypothetical protein